MEFPGKMADIVPVKLGIDSEFKFKCHKNIKCFTKCCRGIGVVLVFYDIIKLKTRLELSSDEFLAIYTTPQLLEKTDLPVVTLKLLDDEAQSCPFVREDGCLVYEDRPTTCRYYPLGSASLSHKEGADDSDFYFFINESHCLGFEENCEWTVRKWKEDQAINIHDDVNAGWTDLLVRKRSFPPDVKLTEQSKKMFFLACYNIDGFRKFISESSFLDRYDIDTSVIQKIKCDELALLDFGVKWLHWLLFKQGNFKLKETVSDKK